MTANLSCPYCLEIIKNPITCFPCGHTFCAKCKKGYMPSCSECKDELSMETTFKNKLLNEILLKIEYFE